MSYSRKNYEKMIELFEIFSIKVKFLFSAFYLWISKFYFILKNSREFNASFLIAVISFFFMLMAAGFFYPLLAADFNSGCYGLSDDVFIEFNEAGEEPDAGTNAAVKAIPADMSAEISLTGSDVEAQFTPEVLVSQEGADYNAVINSALASSRDIRKINLNIKNSENSLLLDEIARRPNFSVTVDNEHNHKYSLSQKVADLVDLSVTKSDNSKKSEDGSINYSLTLDLRRFDNADFDISRLELKRDLMSYAGARESFKLRVIRQFYDLVMAVEECRVLQNSCQRWFEMLDYARSKYELGLANKIDYLNAEVNLANAQNALLQQEQSIQTLKEQFFDLTGFSGETAEIKGIPVKYNITFEKISTEEIALILMNKDGLCVREDVEAERLALEIARLKYRKSRKMTLPKLNLNLIKTDYENKALTSDFSSSITYRFNAGRQDNTVNEWIEKNNYELRKIALEELENSVTIERRDALRRIEYLEKAYEISAKSLRQAYENYEFSKLSFQKGMISNIDLRDAQDKLTSAKRSVVSLIISHKVAVHKFYYAMGKDL